MLTKEISYVDAAGNAVKEELYFNLTKAEITEMEYSVKGGLSAMIETISTTKDIKVVIQIVKDIILRAYGEKYTDSKGIMRFMKNDDIRDAFAATEAYSELFISFVKDPDALNAFIVAIMPLDMQKSIMDVVANKEDAETVTLPIKQS